MKSLTDSTPNLIRASFSASVCLTVCLSNICDPLGRRIAKKVNGTIAEKYLWQGMTRLLAVYDGSDSLLMRFGYADDRMPAAMTVGGVMYYLTYDQVGSLKTVADASGTVVKNVGYDSFGNVISDSNPVFAVPFGFAGGLHDRDTGLVRFGYRDYDPDTGRWTAKDPILFAGGDTDLYGYCVGDPVNWVDPDGLINAAVGAEAGATIGGSLGGPPGAVIGGIIGGAAVWIIGQWIWDNWIDKDKSAPCMEARKKKHEKPENPNKPKGAEDRKKTGDRERNVGHPEGEEHSKRPKGGFRR